MQKKYRENIIGEIIIRDYGYRIEYRKKETDNWEIWAEYKICDNQGDAEKIADALMTNTRSIRWSVLPAGAGR